MNLTFLEDFWINTSNSHIMNIKVKIKKAIISILSQVPIKKHVTANIVNLSPNELLKGRCALITGGTSGIGYSIAEAFIKAGACVVITGRNMDKIQAACNMLNTCVDGDKNAVGYVMDITKTTEISKSFDQILQIIPSHKIDILVNNAGVMGRFGIANADEEMFQSVIDTNLKGPFFLSGIVGKYMRDNGIKGNILNICSSSSIRPANSVYGISKWGLRGFTLGLAKSLLPYGITVNGLAPGPTATPMILKDPKKGISRQGLMERQILPEEIANMAVVLVSGIGKTIIGDVIYMTTGCGVITYDDIPCEF